MKLYHGTNPNVEDTILDEGLKGGKKWSEGQGVFLTPFPQYAADYGWVYEVDLPQEFFDTHPHFKGWDVNEFYIFYGKEDEAIIPPEYISLPHCHCCGWEIGEEVEPSPEYFNTLKYSGKFECRFCYYNCSKGEHKEK